MTDEDAFVRAICEAPEDDTPRLVFADWLQENRDTARAEFIRTQVELARLDAADPRREPLAKRERELWAKRHAWRRLPAEWLRQGLGEYRRGFLWRWVGTVDLYLSRAADLWRDGPIGELSLNGRNRHLVRLAECPHLAAIRGLTLQVAGRIRDGGFALAGSPHLAGLESFLVLAPRPLDPDVREALEARFGQRLRLHDE